MAGSPVLIGAATALIALVAVFLAYNANSGLPFVETYDITAEVADAQQLTTGVDVRIGGKRVGQVNGITARKSRTTPGAFSSSLELKLDRGLGPIPTDSTIRIRPKSVIGAKFVELQLGRSRRTIAAGGVLPQSQSSAAVDVQDFFNAFDAGRRRAVRRVVKEFASAAAGRGAQFNAGLSILPTALLDGGRVLRTLADPSTDLDGFISGLDRASGALSPVAPRLRAAIPGARDTLGAFARADDTFGESIDRTPALEKAVLRAEPVVSPVLLDAASLARELRPGVRALPRTVGALHDAVEVGVPVLRRAITLGPQLRATFASLDDLARQDSTTATLTRLDPIGQNLLAVLQHVAPLEIRCNYLGLFGRNSADMLGDGDEYGNWFRAPLQVLGIQNFKSPDVAPDFRYQVYPDNVPGGCAIGNETFRRGGLIGRDPAQAPVRNPRTPRPAGIPEGPR
ncbi:Long-chain-fatty-acid--CoA ligase [Patulibacter medicamentivorans]|uniref:Long-chain-fatty-acid--CoA ligase n=1 Tax=Patulibacter medicamentivorans TaxID=1097667 RepID=H0E8D3_9ACTN|nr:Long-chain-fatty-acid--CoA ligase [Patulibacter medicamentivorans]